MKTVADLLKHKGPEVWSVGAKAALVEALQLLAQHNIGAVMVIEQGRPVGILSERDIARGMTDEARPLREIIVGELMTRRVAYVEPQYTTEECMALMTDKRVRHLPVMHNDQLVGMISIGDVVKATIEDREFLISQLENYITGR